MLRAQIALLGLAIVFSPLTALCESGPLGWGNSQLFEEMDTDRPDFTEGTKTIEPGHLQIESGYTYTDDDSNGTDLKEHTGPELLARVGIVKDLELRLGWIGYVSSEVNGVKDDGLSDLSIGFKHRMYEEFGPIPALSLIGALSLPTGDDEVSSDEVEGEVKFLWAYDLESYGVAGNINFATPIGDEGRYLEVASSVTIGTDLSESIGTYIEYFGFYPAEDVPETTEHFFNGGFTFALSDDLQLDLRAGTGLNDAAADFFTGAGLSFRI